LLVRRNLCRCVKLTSAATLTFYVQTWDEYHTQTLTLGVVSGPVEGILTMCLVYALTAYHGGGSFWNRPMLEAVGIGKASWMPESVYSLAWTDWFVFYGGILLVFNTCQRYDITPPLLSRTTY
jgi:ethanolaminephosphotransferase